MNIKCNKKIVGMIGLSILFSGCSNESYDIAKNEEKLQIVYRVKTAYEDNQNALKESMQIEKNLPILSREDMLKKTVYVMKSGVKIYKDKEFTVSDINPVKEKTSFFIVNEMKSTDGKTEGYTVKKYYEDSNVLGYLKKIDTVKTVGETINPRYKGVDYEPFVRVEYENNKRVKVKGIYITENVVTTGDRFWGIIEQAKAAGINALVIDVKDDTENILFSSETAKKYNPSNTKVFVKKPKELIEKLKGEGFYIIGRIVAFKSPLYANSYKERAIINKETGELHSDSGMIWASPYDRNLWDYNIGVAKEAADLGFNEIQFDYVRFPASNSGKLDNVLDYRNKLNETKTEAIQKFLLKAKEELSKKEVYVAADVFGWTSSESNDVGIGQHYEAMTNVVDYMCPMVYPSHYGTGIYGIKVPDAHPYTTVYKSMQDALKRDANVMTPAISRPWIQDFSAPWVRGHITYGDEEVAQQINALKALGVEEYILWNASNKYHFKGVR